MPISAGLKFTRETKWPALIRTILTRSLGLAFITLAAGACTSGSEISESDPLTVPTKAPVQRYSPIPVTAIPPVRSYNQDHENESSPVSRPTKVPVQKKSPGSVPAIASAQQSHHDREVAALWCNNYDRTLSIADREGYRTQYMPLILYVSEIRGAYKEYVEEYCKDPSTSPSYRIFLEQVDPSARLGIPEDAKLGSNGQVCMDYYYDVHQIWLEMNILSIQGKDWLSAMHSSVSTLDDGGEARGGFYVGGKSQFCPAILERVSSQE